MIEFELQVHLIKQRKMTAVLQMLIASATGIAITHPVAHRPLHRPRAAVPSLSSEVDTRKNVGLYSGLEEPVRPPVHDIASVRGASSLAVERPPEVLAPAGGWAQARAAVVSGADSIYFGVRGLNARVRAENFAIEEVPELMEYLHSHGVKGFCAVNVLTFDEELRMSEQLVKDLAAGAPASLRPSLLPPSEAELPTSSRRASPATTHAPSRHPTPPRAAAVDALIVQDPAVVMIAKRAAPHLPIHASTQQTITSAEGAEWAAAMGCERVVLGRELSVREIGAVVDKCSVEVEVFVHGGEHARRRARSRRPAAPRSADEPSACDSPGRWSGNILTRLTHHMRVVPQLCACRTRGSASPRKRGAAAPPTAASARRRAARLLPCSHAPMLPCH